jgi:hypothetical protein
MKAIIWIVVLILIIWGIWWLVHRNNTAGIPATGSDVTGQVDGASDAFTASTTQDNQDNSNLYNSKG